MTLTDQILVFRAWGYTNKDISEITDSSHVVIAVTWWKVRNRDAANRYANKSYHKNKHKYSQQRKEKRAKFTKEELKEDAYKRKLRHCGVKYEPVRANREILSNPEGDKGASI